MHSEQSIAAAMSISRTPIREAILQLSGEGLIEFIPQRGVRVTDIIPEYLVQVFELRAAIEGYCAAQLAMKPNPEVIAALEAELERQKKLIREDNRLVWVQANMDFHTRVVSGGSHGLMRETLAPLASHTMRIGYRMNSRRQRMEESLYEHTAVVDAIRRNDAERARALASEHLYITTVLMKQMINDLSDAPKKKNHARR
jgi:DNA-binding GntR family transcriptional regulator